MRHFNSLITLQDIFSVNWYDFCQTIWDVAKSVVRKNKTETKILSSCTYVLKYHRALPLCIETRISPFQKVSVKSLINVNHIRFCRSTGMCPFNLLNHTARDFQSKIGMIFVKLWDVAKSVVRVFE